MKRAGLWGHVLVMAGSVVVAVGAAGEWATGVAFGGYDPARPPVRIWMFLAATLALLAGTAMAFVRRSRRVEVGAVAHMALVVVLAVWDTRVRFDGTRPPLEASISWGLYAAAVGVGLAIGGVLLSWSEGRSDGAHIA